MDRTRFEERTTWHEVVEPSRTRIELVTRLYEFTLRASPPLPHGATVDDVREVTSGLIEALLQETDPRVTCADNDDGLAATARALDRLSRPRDHATPPHHHGWRNRIRRELVRRLRPPRRERPLEVEPLDRRIEGATGRPLPSFADLDGSPLLERVRSGLDQCRARMLADVLGRLPQRSRHLALARAVVGILDAHACAQSRHGLVVADHYRAALKLPARDVAQALLRDGMYVRHGKRARSPSSVHRVIRQVRALMLDAVDELRRGQDALVLDATLLEIVEAIESASGDPTGCGVLTDAKPASETGG